MHLNVAVSIPFIAGQWSLRARLRARAGRSRVSIPFIAGQWSLQLDKAHGDAEAIVFQSPSLRGSGRFRGARGNLGPPPPCFNPLHCGAVVASHVVDRRAAELVEFQSPSLRGSGRFSLGWSVRLVSASRFQSPSLRGSGRFCRDRGSARRRREVSIPFIAGQWSLPRRSWRRCRTTGSVSIPFIAGQWSLPTAEEADGPFDRMFQSPSLRGSGRFGGRGGPNDGRKTCFNPLHCGAVVASMSCRRLRISCTLGFNPLHCGAVVASPRTLTSLRGWRLVSIPFIAGQWSLPR